MILKKTVTEVARNFSHLINNVSYNHDTIILIRGKKEVAELRPVLSGLPVEDFLNVIKSSPHLSESGAESYSEDIEEIRKTMNEDSGKDPWE